MSYFVSKFVKIVKKYPLVRGMVSYSIIWPTSSLIQQTVEGKVVLIRGALIVVLLLRSELEYLCVEPIAFAIVEKYDWARCARYCLYGSCFVAPTLYSWLTVANIMWPGTTISAGLIKAAVEQLTYTPMAMCSFYFFMSMLENKPINECIAEASNKFLPTYKVAVCIWPMVAMINFCLIPPRNRVPFISCCSLIWTCFLAYMKHLEDVALLSEDTRNITIKIPKLALT